MDHASSVRAVADSGAIGVQTSVTDAFGNPASQPFGYTGQPTDPLGLVDLRARVYAPALGRFLQRDPAAGNIADPLSLNRSTYARNNPASLTDPSGLTPSNKVLSFVLGASSESDTNCEASDPLCDTSTQITVSGENSSDAGGGGGGGGGDSLRYSVAPYGRQPSPRPGLQAHHIVQDAWAQANVRGYSRNLAPSTLLPRAQNVIVNALQTARQGARIAAGGVGAAWSTTFDQEVANARSDLESAGVPVNRIHQAIQAALGYFGGLGGTPSP